MQERRLRERMPVAAFGGIAAVRPYPIALDYARTDRGNYYSHRAYPRPRGKPCVRRGCGHDHRQRDFSGSSRHDAGCGLCQTGVSGLAGGRGAVVFRRPDVHGTGRDEAAGRREYVYVRDG
jgi:hypothetical protein